MLGRILVTLGGLVVVALFAALLAPLFVNWTDFRKEFEVTASRILGKKVEVHGSVSARLLPFPSVTLENVTVGVDADGQPLVHVARFALDAELAPFLSGEARIFDMRIEEPKARLRLLGDGSLDWLRGSDIAIPARSVVLENISVSGGEIQFVDEQSSRTWLLTDLNAAISADTLAGPWSVEGRVALDGERTAFSFSTNQPGPTGLPLRVRLQPDDRPVTLALDGLLALVEGKPIYVGGFAANILSAPDPAAAGGDEQPAPRLRGDFTLTNDRIEIPTYRLEVGPLIDPYVVTGEAKLDAGLIPEFLLTANGQQVDVNRLSGQGAQAKTNRNVALSVQKRLESLYEIAAAVPIPSVPGKASFKLPAIVAGDTVVRDVQLEIVPAGDGWTIESAVALFPGRTQLEASGRLVLDGEPSFVGDLLVASTQPSGLASWIAGSVDPALRQLRSVGFSASVNLTPQLQRLEDLELSVGPAILKGRIERETPAGAASSLSVDLSGPALDFDAARAIATLVAGEEGEQKVLADQMAARLKIDSVRAFGVDSLDVDAVFTVDDGSVSVERLNVGDIVGTSLRMNGSAEGSIVEHTGEARVLLTSADPTAFLQLLSERLNGRPWIEHLRRHAVWFADASLAADIAFGSAQDGGLVASVTGTVNQSRVTASYQNSDLFDLAGQAETQTIVKLANDEAQILLGQAGLAPLPFETGTAGELQLTLGDRSNGASTAIVFADGSGTQLTADAVHPANPADLRDGDWTISLTTPDAGPYLLAVGSGVADLAGGLAVDLKGTLKHANERTEIGGISGTVNSGAVSVSGQVEWLPVAAKFTGDIGLDALDLSWLAQSVVGPISDPATGEFVRGPLSTASAAFDVDANLSVVKFYPGYADSIGDFTAKLRRSSRELVLEDVAGNWLGGRLTGRLTLANAESSGLLQTRLDVKDAAIGGTLAALSAERGLAAAGIEGRYDLTLVGESTGNSVSDLMTSLSGSGELRVAAVKLPGLRLDILPAVLEEADGMGTEVTEATVTTITERLMADGVTEISEATLPFSLVDGTVRVQNARAEATGAVMTGNLRLDLPTFDVNGDMRVSLSAGDEALTGADPEFQLDFTGDVLAPVRSLRATDLSNFVALRAFERERRRVEALQSNVLEKQRLRREAALARFSADQRAQAAAAEAAEAERLRREDEMRIQDAAAAEAEAQAEAGAPNADGSNDIGADPTAVPPEPPLTTDSTPPSSATPVQPTPLVDPTVNGQRIMPVPRAERVIREPLPPVLNRFEDLPGVN